MINFTVGPVQTSKKILDVGAEQVPYFRTPEFSRVMIENEKYIKKFAFAGLDSKVLFITGSGTAAMEAAIINSFNSEDKLLIINGGSFGQRFVDICNIHSIRYEEIILDSGTTLTKEKLNEYDNLDYTGLLVNVHETSTGVLYDMEVISEFSIRNNLFLVVDAISSFLADPFYFDDFGVDVMIIGSQKALACPPGISILVLSTKSINKIKTNKVKSLYFDLKDALKNAERGQTPFTPAVGILRQLNIRLKEIDEQGGVGQEIKRINSLANNFRDNIKSLPFKISSKSMSNALTPLSPVKVSAEDVVRILKDEYHIWVTPNGGMLKDKIFRVGHLGAISIDDNNKLIDALNDMNKRGLI